jgi:hypothetical protein
MAIRRTGRPISARRLATPAAVTVVALLVGLVYLLLGTQTVFDAVAVITPPGALLTTSSPPPPPETDEPELEPFASALEPSNNGGETAGNEREADDEPPYNVDTDGYRTTYDPMSLSLAMVQPRYRALAEAFPRCRIGKRRKPVYLIYDPANGDVDLEPPVTAEAAKQVVPTDRTPLIQPGAWPSQVAAKSQQADDAPRDTQQSCLKSNAMVAFAFGYDDSRLRPLVRSFQRYAHPCDGLYLIRDKCLTLTTDPEPAPRVYCEEASTHMSPERGRLAVIAAWVSRNYLQFHYIIHVDSRDTAFYADPFAPLFEHHIDGLFGGGEYHRLADHPTDINRDWIALYSTGIDARDTTVVDFIARRKLGGRPFPVICSGMYGGTGPAMLDFTAAFADAFKHAGHSQKAHGIDQGILIHLYAVGLAVKRFPHRIHLVDEMIGPYTHFIPREQPAIFSLDDRMLNCDLRPYGISHQWDRHKDITQRLEARYAPHDSRRRAPYTVKAKCSSDAGVGSVSLQACLPRPENPDSWDRLGGTLLRWASAFDRGLPSETVSAGARESRVVTSTRHLCPASRNLIVATAANAGWATIETFLSSVFRYHRTCVEVHLLVFSPRPVTKLGELLAAHFATHEASVKLVVRVLPLDRGAASATLAERVEACAGYLRARSPEWSPESQVTVFLTVGDRPSAQRRPLLDPDPFGEPRVLVVTNLFDAGPWAPSAVTLALEPTRDDQGTVVGSARARARAVLEALEAPVNSTKHCRQGRGLGAHLGNATDPQWCPHLVSPVYAAGRLGAVSRYLRLGRRLVREGCDASAVFSYLLPTALRISRRGPLMHVNVRPADDPHASVAVLRGGAVVPFDATSTTEFGSPCDSGSRGPAVALGLDDDRLWNDAARDYENKACRPDVLSAQLLSEARDGQRSLAKFASAFGLREGDELPFSSLMPHGARYFE